MVKAYKGFNKDMTCRGFQFKEGETYHEDEADLCNSGFHACENPLDCFGYYEPGHSFYHEVELDELSDKKCDDSKICGKTIKIGARLDVAKICKAHFGFVKSKTSNVKKGNDHSSLAAQDCSSLAARDHSSLAAQGYSSLAARENSVIAAFNSRVKGGRGTLIALAVREWRDDKYCIVDFAAGIVDGKEIKADTWYEVKDGKFVEVVEDAE